MDKLITFTVVLLAGGTGTRMKSDIPKQYLPLHGKPLALHSFEVFLTMPEIDEIVVVCEPQYEELFLAYQSAIPLSFASPGKRRQDSVFNGLQGLKGNPLVCIHDAARPFITPEIVRHTVQTAKDWDAAVLGVKVKSTFKVCDGAQVVINTPDREHLWEIQTPQVIRLSLLKEGFRVASMKNCTVTDDVSLVELLGKPVKVVEGSYANIKITTPDDLVTATNYLDNYALLQTHHRL